MSALSLGEAESWIVAQPTDFQTFSPATSSEILAISVDCKTIHNRRRLSDQTVLVTIDVYSSQSGTWQSIGTLNGSTAADFESGTVFAYGSIAVESGLVYRFYVNLSSASTLPVALGFNGGNYVNGLFFNTATGTGITDLIFSTFMGE